MKKQTLQLNKALVAFIDILGFGSKVKTIKTQTDLEETHKQLTFIQNEFERNPKDEKKEDHKYMGKKVLTFSDCIVISINMKSRDTEMFGNFDPILAQLHMMGLSQAICVCNNIFFRGGISLGTWFHSKDIMISSALVEAYEIDRKIANVPIMVLSEKTYNFFSIHPHRNWYASNTDPVKWLFRKYKKINGNVIYFLDYLGIGFDGSADWHSRKDLEAYRATKDDNKKNEILRGSCAAEQKIFLNCHKEAVIKGFLGSPNDRIKSKYIWLFKYHNQFISALNYSFHECLIDVEQYK